MSLNSEDYAGGVSKTVLLMRTHGTGLVALNRLCELLDKQGVMCAPIIFPFCFPLEYFSVTDEKYDMKKVIVEARKSVGLKDIPLIILSSNLRVTSHELVCDNKQKTCIVSIRESEISDKFVKKILSFINNISD